MSQPQDPQAAYQHLLDNVYASTFLQKLASYGISPSTEGEYEDLFTIAAHLRVHAPEKSAASSRFGMAKQALAGYTAQTPVADAVAAETMKSAAVELASDPSIYNAVLTLLAAENNTLAGSK